MNECPTCGAPINKDALLVERQARAVARWEQVVYLTAMPFTIFTALYDAMPRPLHRWYLAELLWGDEHDKNLNCLSVHIWRLKRQLGAMGVRVVAIRGSWHDRTDTAYRLIIEDVAQ